MPQSGKSGLTSRSRPSKQQTDIADSASKAANDHQKDASQQTDIAGTATKAPNDHPSSASQQTDNAGTATTAPNDHPSSASTTTKQQTDNADTNTVKDSTEMTAITALFDTPAVVEKAKVASRPRRPKVKVPEHVLATLRAAKENSERLAWPLPSGITEDRFKEMCNVFYSAADQLGGTAIILLGKETEDEEDTYDRVKELSEATHVRVSIGRRRGARKNGQKNGTGDSDK